MSIVVIGHTTRAAGTILTASIYNTDHLVHIQNVQNLNLDKLSSQDVASPFTVPENNAGEDTAGALLTVQQSGAGDAVLQWLLPSTRSWYAGIDNSDNDSWKLATTSGTPDFGTDTVLTVNPTTGFTFGLPVSVTQFSSFGILDSGADHSLLFSVSNNFTANRTLTLAPGDTNRTITLQGNPTLSDWFDQSVKQAATPTFAGATLTTTLVITQGSANTALLTSTGYSVTGSNTTSAIDIAGTWNTTGAPTAILMNITNTASDGNSRCLDFRVGGSSVFLVGISGFVSSTNVIAATQGYYVNNSNTRLEQDSGNVLKITSAGNQAWVACEEANVFALRHTTSANELRVYRTWTNASNYERQTLQSGSGYFEWAAETAGTGTDNIDLRLTPAGTGDVSITTGDLLLPFNATFNFGSGNVTVSHSTGILTVGTGELRVTNAGTNTSSVVTIGATQTLTNKTFVAPALGTPASGVLTNCTGLPVSGIAGLGTGIATFLATPTSANLASAITNETGSAGSLVFSTNPTIAGMIGTGVFNLGGASSFELPNSASPTVNANGEIAVDTTVSGFDEGLITYYSTNQMMVIAVPLAQFPPNDGEVITYNSASNQFEFGAGGGGGGTQFTFDYVTTDETNTSGSTLIDSSLSLAVGANEIWGFEFHVMYSHGSFNVSGKFSVNGPASPTNLIFTEERYNSTGSLTVARTGTAYDSVDTTSPGTNTGGFVTLRGTIEVGATGGTLALRYANTSSPSTTILQGSTMRAWQLA